MFDTIILLTDPLEAEALTTALLRRNPDLAVHSATTLDALDALDAIAPRQLKRARLIAFASTVIVPGRVLSRLGYGAYNFHPGPPDYPGWAPSCFAIYDRATRFGVTAHVMHERVDSGPIIDVDLFDVPAGTSVESLDEMTYARLARQFFALADPLATSPHPLPTLPVQWCGRKNTQRRCAALCEIPADISHDELERRMAAFGDGRLGVAPTITLHGRPFRYVSAAAMATEAAVSPADGTPIADTTPAAPVAAVPA